MSSICGIMTVKAVVSNKPDARKKFTVFCEGEGAPKRILSNNNYPIGTRIYWEYWYRDNKWAFMVMNE